MTAVQEKLSDNTDNEHFVALRKKLRQGSKVARNPRNGIWGLIGIPRRGERLFAGLDKGFAYSSIDALLETGFVNKSELSRFTGITKSTLDRRRLEGHLNTQESDRLYRLVRLLDEAASLFSGDENMANQWIRKSTRGLGGRAPVEMIRTAAETESVVDYIGRVKHGIPV